MEISLHHELVPEIFQCISGLDVFLKLLVLIYVTVGKFYIPDEEIIAHQH